MCQVITTKSVTRSRKCGICGEQLYNEDAQCIVNDDSRIVAAYCEHHLTSDILLMHPDAVTERTAELIEEIGYDINDSMRQFERAVEDHAAYRAAGVSTEVYFRDRDAGFAY
jgi:hypothetical protein